jgi:hypothetical protein
MIGNPNEMIRDHHPLWRDFHDNRFQRPYMHGVVGPQWMPPVAEQDDGFNLISSPTPKPELARRIHADELPPLSYSQSSFDMPKRRDVLQVDLPTAIIRTVETHDDPRFPKKVPVERVHGILYHGTGSTDPQVVMPMGFKQVDNNIADAAKSARQEGVDNARVADAKASRSIDDITHNVVGNPEMILPIVMKNVEEKPSLEQYDNNNNITKIKRIAEMRNTPIGVRAAHTIRRLG